MRSDAGADGTSLTDQLGVLEQFQPAAGRRRRQRAEGHQIVGDGDSPDDVEQVAYHLMMQHQYRLSRSLFCLASLDLIPLMGGLLPAVVPLQAGFEFLGFGQDGEHLLLRSPTFPIKDRLARHHAEAEAAVTLRMFQQAAQQLDELKRLGAPAHILGALAPARLIVHAEEDERDNGNQPKVHALPSPGISC